MIQSLVETYTSYVYVVSFLCYASGKLIACITENFLSFIFIFLNLIRFDWIDRRQLTLISVNLNLFSLPKNILKIGEISIIFRADLILSLLKYYNYHEKIEEERKAK